RRHLRLRPQARSRGARRQALGREEQGDFLRPTCQGTDRGEVGRLVRGPWSVVRCKDFLATDHGPRTTAKTESWTKRRAQPFSGSASDTLSPGSCCWAGWPSVCTAPGTFSTSPNAATAMKGTSRLTSVGSG